MSNVLTLTLPDELYRSAERMAASASRPVSGMIAEVLNEALRAWEEPETPISALSDKEVLALSELQMAADQSQRLSVLLAKQRERELTDDEKPELWTLMRVYERALLRRSEALMEAVKRGLREPLNS